ncbi:MAG: hypothetical protein GX552_04670 [Chloroflexi bacterium]|jgi:hypothetical protein|nr:hypothetical protein [Chloroflexota bacterium]
MCCVLTVLVLAGPRLAILIWWLLNPLRWQVTFPNFIVPLLGFILLPFTTLMYVLVAPGGVVGFDWVWLVLALLLDLGSYGGGAYGNRERLGYR